MRAPRPIPRAQVMFTVLIILLSFLAAMLWFGDPAHQWHGNSRVNWPPATAPKP